MIGRVRDHGIDARIGHAPHDLDAIAVVQGDPRWTEGGFLDHARRISVFVNRTNDFRTCALKTSQRSAHSTWKARPTHVTRDPIFLDSRRRPPSPSRAREARRLA